MPVDPTSAQTRLQETLASGTALILAGAGVTINATARCLRPAPTWEGLLRLGLEWCETHIVGTDDAPLSSVAIQQHREDLSIASGLFSKKEAKLGRDKLLAVAEAVHAVLHETGQLYDWLESALGALPGTPGLDPTLIEALGALGGPILTTNYDTTIESVLGWESLTWRDREAFAKALRASDPVVIHLHGVWSRPDTIVLGRRSYTDIRHDRALQALQKAFRSLRPLVMVGCGSTTDDPNLGDLARWARTNLSSALPWSYLLVTDSDAATVKARLMGSDKVDLVPYGQHADLPGFVQACLPGAIQTVRRRRPSVAPPSPPGDSRSLPGWHAFRQAMLARADRVPTYLGGAKQSQHHVNLFVDLDLEPLGPMAWLDRPGQAMRMEDMLAIEEKRQWSISGEPGSGKSTLLQVTARRLLDNGALVPILLSISDLCRAGGVKRAVAEVVRAEVGDGVAAGAAEVASTALDDGSAAVLLDGLDEEPDIEGARKAIRSAVVEAQGCRFVVAGRPIAYESSGLGSDFEPLRILPLDEGRARKLLGRRLDDLAQVEAVLGGLRRSRQQAVLQSPLMLTLLSRFLQEAEPGTDVPDDRVDLYERLVPLLVSPPTLPAGSNERERFGDREAARRHLEEVALAVHVTPGNRVPEERVIAALWACGLENDAGVFLRQAAVVTGLVQLSTLASGEREVLFQHRTLREFLAAGALVREIRRQGLVGKRVRWVLDAVGKDPSTWAEVLALVAGLLSRPEPRDDALPWWGRTVAPAKPPSEPLNTLVREVASRSTPVGFRALVHARGLAAQTILDVVGVDPSRDAWKLRAEVFERLPELAEDAAVAISLVPQVLSAARTTHGADLFWAREVLRQVAESVGEGPEADTVRGEALATMARLYDHMPGSAERKAQALEALEPLWRTVPPDVPHRFRMGSPVDETGRWEAEGPAHDVEVSDRFAIMSVPVSNALYRLFDPAHSGEDDQAVTNVSWWEATAFATWLAVGARLPTEIEWEAACRAGSTSRFWSGDGDADVERIGWVGSNSGGRMPALGQLQANPWGLHDMHGNVWEWCADVWRIDYARYADGRAYNPRAWTPSSEPRAKRALRGGSWDFASGYARSAFRNGGSPANRRPYIGFRLARPAAPADDGSTN